MDDLFDKDAEEEYREEEEEGVENEEQVGVSELFGDVDDLEVEESEANGQTTDRDSGDGLNKSKEDLQGLCGTLRPSCSCSIVVKQYLDR